MQNLYQLAKKCFLSAEPSEKIACTFDVAGSWLGEQLEWQSNEAVELLAVPGRLRKPEIVAPRDLDKRSLKSESGRASLIHSLAHIELTAVNLAWDAVYRYQGMPKPYYDDWVRCAVEEARHFSMLRDHLREMGYDYGDFPVHDELWKMAVSTSGDLIDRMGIVHRVFEARALDVAPNMLNKFEQINDIGMTKTLTVICNDEIGHVASGSKWFRYRCEQKNLEPEATFFALIEKYMTRPLRGPFNHKARLKAGFTHNELAHLEARANDQL